MEISVIIPCYYSSSVIEKIIGEINISLKAIDHEIILIDDGNPPIEKDKLMLIASKFTQVKLFSLPINMGQHLATQYGAFRACGAYMVSMDDDGQHNPSGILVMRDFLEQHHFELVYAHFPFYFEAKWRSYLRKTITNHCGLIKNTLPRKTSFRIWNRRLQDDLKLQGFTNELFDIKCLRCTPSIGYFRLEQRPSLLPASRYTFIKLIKYLFQSIPSFNRQKI